MRNSVPFLLFFLFFIACASPSQIPAWKNNATAYLEDYKIGFLTGKEGPNEPHFAKARRELSSGNDLHLLSVAYLTKYALHAASLENFETSEFARLYRLEPTPAHMAYCHLLKGNFSAVEPTLLPPQYQGFLRAALSGDVKIALREISSIHDPLSRLIACGIWTRYFPSDENLLQMAIQTASAQGWRRPLLAYLEKLQIHYTTHGNQAQAQAVGLRLEILKK
jgi:hypothetical protein